jgi:hypothetical protein
MIRARPAPELARDRPAAARWQQQEGFGAISASWRSLFVRVLAALGLASLCYLLGAAVVFFDLPSSAFLRRGFAGAVASFEGQPTFTSADSQASPPAIGQVDRPDKTCDGFTLCMYGTGSQAMLINMRGDVVHRWQVPFSKLWPNPTHVRGPVDDATVYFNDGHLFSNGELIVVIEGPTDKRNASNGFGLAKLDRDSNVLWKYAERCHHDVDVGEDGRVYAITNETAWTVPAGLERIPTPCIVDELHVLAANGTRIKKIALLEAIYASPYAALLGVYEKPSAPGMVTIREDAQTRDVLHTNAVKVLSTALAPKFPRFKAGQVLISPRQLDALVVLDPDSGAVVWATRGPWRAQHDPSFLDNGHLLLFDNLGSARGSRVLEYDPQTQAFPWSYPDAAGKPFVSRIRGLCQRLPNGNTLIVNSVGGEALEVTPGREVVWSCSSGGVEFCRARRYTPDQVPFLKGDVRARP